MKHRAHTVTSGGFTLVELLIGFAVIALLLVLAAPSFTSMIEMQRLRGTTDQLNTDIQFMRTEAVTRQEVTGISFGENSTMTCYVVHTCSTVAGDDCFCDCTLSTPTSRCIAPRREVKVVQLLKSAKVEVRPVRVGTASMIANHIVLVPATGQVEMHYPVMLTPMPLPTVTEFWAESALSATASRSASLQTRVNLLGRPSLCAPGGNVNGPTPCP